MTRALLAIFAVVTTLSTAQDGAALAGVQELINSFFNRESR